MPLSFSGMIDLSFRKNTHLLQIILPTIFDGIFYPRVYSDIWNLQRIAEESCIAEKQSVILVQVEH